MSESDVLVSRVGRLGHIRLNRPKALNSLTLEMVRRFARALDEFGGDEGTIAVLVTGAGERGLCAGGDIRGLFDWLGAGEHPYKQFWREEYRLNARIASFPKPYVVLMDGIVMGGGVGVSAHGNRRLVTERTRLAMPETGIGFIPDVGASWLLTRDGGAGVYMGLSGATVGPADAIFLGFADLCIDSGDIVRLISCLEQCERPQDVDAALQELPAALTAALDLALAEPAGRASAMVTAYALVGFSPVFGRVGGWVLVEDVHMFPSEGPAGQGEAHH